ncbi:MAG: DMP19 family protein [Nitrospira sp.]|nr:DMP19 family protein [Nitrospira sp.]
MRTAESVFERIDKEISPFNGYKEALAALERLTPGYKYCFAFHYVDADICNGGITQLYENPTWVLITTAVEACNCAGAFELEMLLRQVVLYYHQRGRSRLKKKLCPDFFDGLDLSTKKTLSELEDEYLSLEPERIAIVSRLAESNDPSVWHAA